LLIFLTVLPIVIVINKESKGYYWYTH
jgi:hypothetical protein